MYDMAKRGVAFAVATGGLLLAGPAYACTDAPASAGALPGSSPAQPGQGAAAAAKSDASSTTTRENITAEAYANAQTHAQAQGQTPEASRPAAGSARVTAAATSGLASGNSIQIPALLGLNLCGNQINALGHSSGSACSISGGGAAATTSGKVSGLLSGNSVQTPVTLPVNVCGNTAAVAGSGSSAEGTTCSIVGDVGGSAESLPQTGGLLSGNALRLPIELPLNLCGESVAVASSQQGGTSCAFAESTAQTTQQSPPATPSSTAPKSSSTALAAPPVQPNLTAGRPAAGADLSGTAQATQGPALAVVPAAVTTPVPTALPPADPAENSRPVNRIIVHPQVVWPRPESVALAVPAAHAASPVDPEDLSLAHTGSEVLLPVGAAVGALTAGFGLRASGRRRRT